MQALTLTIPVDDHLPGDTFRVFGNVDAAGRATSAIDFDSPLAGPAPFWPEIGPQAGFLGGPWLTGLHLSRPAMETGFLGGPWVDARWLPDPDAVYDREAAITPLYFGAYSFAVKTYDPAGNVDTDPPAELAVTINSGPRPPRRFWQTGVSGGLPVFQFEAPVQFEFGDPS